MTTPDWLRWAVWVTAIPGSLILALCGIGVLSEPWSGRCEKAWLSVLYSACIGVVLVSVLLLAYIARPWVPQVTVLVLGKAGYTEEAKQ